MFCCKWRIFNEGSTYLDIERFTEVLESNQKEIQHRKEELERVCYQNKVLFQILEAIERANKNSRIELHNRDAILKDYKELKKEMN